MSLAGVCSCNVKKVSSTPIKKQNDSHQKLKVGKLLFVLVYYVVIMIW